MSEDRKQLQVVLPRANGVSSAIWPASARRCLATSKEAQRHRYMIINGKKWMLFPLFLVVVATMGISAALVAAFALHIWYLLPVAALLLLVLLAARAGINAGSIFWYLRGREWSSYALLRKKTGVTGRKVVRRAKRPQAQVAPRTPMPELPLVRVLETIDLSRSSIEHFVDRDENEGYRQNTGELLLHTVSSKNAR